MNAANKPITIGDVLRAMKQLTIDGHGVNAIHYHSSLGSGTDNPLDVKDLKDSGKYRTWAVVTRIINPRLETAANGERILPDLLFNLETEVDFLSNGSFWLVDMFGDAYSATAVVEIKQNVPLSPLHFHGTPTL